MYYTETNYYLEEYATPQEWIASYDDTLTETATEIFNQYVSDSSLLGAEGYAILDDLVTMVINQSIDEYKEWYE